MSSTENNGEIVTECLWDVDGKYAVKETDWECPGCSSYNDDTETIDGKEEQLYKCATCDATRPGFATIRKKKEAELAKKAIAKGDIGQFEISFGGSTVNSTFATEKGGGSKSTSDLFGLGAAATSSSSSAGVDIFSKGTAENNSDEGAPSVDIFGNKIGSNKDAPNLDIFGNTESTSSDNATVSFGISADVPSGDLFGLNTESTTKSTTNPKKRKRSQGGPDKRARKETPEKKPVPEANVEYVLPLHRTPVAGHLYAFGSGEVDQLGHGKQVEDEDGIVQSEVNTPKIIGQVKDHTFIHVSCGGLHSAAVDANGKIWTWGCNDDKALGRVCDNAKQDLIDFYKRADPKKSKEAIEKLYTKYNAQGRIDDLHAKLGQKYGFFPNGESIPGIVTAVSEACVQVECGDNHTVALTRSGRVFLWGCYKDAAGQLGFDSEGTNKQVLPTEVPGLFKTYGRVVQVASGGNHTLALTDKGKVIAWGDAEQGQVARKVPSRHKQQGLRLHPVSFPRGTTIKAAFASGFSSFAVAEGGKTFCWGLNNYGQLGNGAHESMFTVVDLAIPHEQIVQVSGGIHHSLVLTRAGRVYAMGKCESGQLGGPRGKFIKTGIATPTMIEALDTHTVVEIASGSNHNLCRTSEGRVFVWGSNTMSQLGLGDDEDGDEVFIPMELSVFPKGATVLQLQAGAQHSVILAASSN